MLFVGSFLLKKRLGAPIITGVVIWGLMYI